MKSIYKEIKKYLDKQEAIELKTVLNGECGDVRTQMKRSLGVPLPKTDSRGRASFQMQTIYEKNQVQIYEPITPMERMVILGAGHIAQVLCPFAAKCGFAVTVVDDRPVFANKERFPDAVQILAEDFIKSLKELKITAYDYVVVVTRGHFHDADCIRELLSGTEPAYLGLIGSRKRVQAQLIMLEQEGFSRERMNRIHTPVGLAIGAATPAEIAVSILAEVIACKRLSNDGIREGTCVNDSDLDPQFFMDLREDEQAVAFVTLIEANGSTPRKAGARMLVRKDGSIAGTIGGGKSEGLAILEAQKIIGTGTYRILDFDLSGNVAEADGMVCGGSVRILIEDMSLFSQEQKSETER